jgi:Aerotolerance regulator N-terminal
MGFLNPLYLALGAAVAIPLIIHLFQRHQGPRVVFPALRYLRRAETEHARRIRFRQLLLMLLRIAAFVLLAIAAARPFLRATGIGHEPTAVAIVLDNSMSTSLVTGDRRLLDELKDLALATLDQAEAEDVFWLIRAGAPWEPAWPGDADATARRVRETQPSSGAADLVASLDRARSVLEAGAAGHASEIHLLSDLQATNIADRLPEGSWPPILAWIPDRETPPNTALAAVEIGGGVLPIAGQRSTVAALVSGDSTADSVNVRMAIDGRVIAAATAPVRSSTILPFPAREVGFVTGWIEKDPDALRTDDKRWFATRVAPPPAVATGAPLGIVEEALAVLEQASRIRRADLRSADVVLLAAGRSIEAVPPGRGLVILPPDSVLELPAVNRRLAGAGIPWRYETADGVGELRFESRTENDPTLRSLDQVRVSLTYRITPEGGATADTVLLRLSDGSPWAIRGSRADGGRYLLLASPLSESATTLPMSPSLVPLLDRMLGAWVLSRASIDEAAPGQQIGLPPNATAIQTPDSIIEPASGAYRFGEKAGVYRLLAGDSVIGVVAVNPPAAESELRRATARDIRESVPGAEVITADRPQQWTDRIYRRRVGREIWRALALIALLILGIEALVAATGARSDRRSPSTPSKQPRAASPETITTGE